LCHSDLQLDDLMKYVLVAVLGCVEVGCGTSTVRYRQPESNIPLTKADAYSRFRVLISRLDIEKPKRAARENYLPPRIVGKVKNQSDGPYNEISMLVHIYDEEGVRILQQQVTAKSLLPGETVKIDEPLKVNVDTLSVNLDSAAKCEAKAVLVK
jgi:hypothetical protein